MSRFMKVVLSSIRARLKHRAAVLREDCRGVAATEFAIIVPMMLVLFFGTVEISSAIAVDRKVTVMARTLSDLASQSSAVVDDSFPDFFKASLSIMSPYTGTTNSTITELCIDSGQTPRVKWSKGSSPRAVGTTVNDVPTALRTAGTYLIFSEVNYKYVPRIGYVITPNGITMSDVAYTRPRLNDCVPYSPTAPAAPCPSPFSCP